MNILEGILLCGLPIMFLTGVFLGHRQRIPPSQEELYRFMDRIVSMEEVEEHQRLTKFRMARNGRKTQRSDGGPNAKIMRVKVRPVAKRFREHK